MKTIEIDWKQIYEANPKALIEWVEIFSGFKITKMEVGGIGITISGASDYFKNYASEDLNAKALDLILWLDSKGVHVIVDVDIAEKEHGLASWMWDISGKDINESSVDWYRERQTALAAGILKAFELLKGKNESPE